MRGSQDSSGVAFRSFLSHRYQSPRINECFFPIFSADADPQFAVDPGTIATSVTRLERLIRDADAFIEIYPFPEDTDVRVERLKSESRTSGWSWILRNAPPNRQWCLSTVESGNCEHAAREMLSRRDARKMKVVPVKLRQGDLTIPVEFGEMQYLRMWEYRDPGSLVDTIIRSIDV